MIFDEETLKEYASSISEEVAIRFSKTASIDETDFSRLKYLIRTEIEFAFSGMIEKQNKLTNQ